MSEQPEGTQLVTQLGDAVGGPEIPGPDPETETVDLRRKLWNLRRLGESMAESGNLTIRRCGEQVLATLGDAALPVAAVLDRDPMWHRAYMDVQKVLDEALGSEEEDGAGSGIAGDVWLLAHQRDAARAEAAQLRDTITAMNEALIAGRTDGALPGMELPAPALRSPVAEATGAGEGKDGDEEESRER